MPKALVPHKLDTFKPIVEVNMDTPNMHTTNTADVCESASLVEATVLDAGDDMALVVEARAGRQLDGIEARATEKGCELIWFCADGRRERLVFKDAELAVQRRLWFLLETEGVLVFEVEPTQPKTYTALAVLFVDRVDAVAV